MGTYFTDGATRADVVAEILEPLRRGDHLVVSRITDIGDEPILWTVEKGVKDGKPYQFIGCYILRYAQSGWGYKPMDETTGPCFYSVPVEWIDKYPCIMPDEMYYGYSKEWRKKIKAGGRNRPTSLRPSRKHRRLQHPAV